MEQELKNRIEALYDAKRLLQIEIETVEQMLRIVASTTSLPVSDFVPVDFETIEDTVVIRKEA